MPDTIRYRYADLPDGPQMHLAEMGSGAPLLLLHASPRSHRSFRRLMPLLAPHFRAIAVDMPGFGNSPPLEQIGSLEEVAARYVALLDVLGLPRADILGFHSGNKIAGALAARWPDRVGKVVLLGQTHSIIADAAAREAEIRRLSQHHFPDFGPSPDGTHHLRRWLIAQSVVQGYWWTPDLLNGREVSSDCVDDARQAVIDYLSALPSQLKMYRAVYDYDLDAAYRAMTARTLVLELVTPEEEARHGRQGGLLAAMMRDATYQVIENADGRTLETRPEAIADRILPFLKA